MLVTGTATNSLHLIFRPLRVFSSLLGRIIRGSGESTNYWANSYSYWLWFLDVSKASFTLSDSLKIDPSKWSLQWGFWFRQGKRETLNLRYGQKSSCAWCSVPGIKNGSKEAAATMGAALQIARKGAALRMRLLIIWTTFWQKYFPLNTKKSKEKFRCRFI